MAEERRISLAVIGIGAGIGIAAAIGIYALARAAPPPPPPEGYVCPYCGDTFSTYEELVTHVQTEHPGERIPIPIEWE